MLIAVLLPMAAASAGWFVKKKNDASFWGAAFLMCAVELVICGVLAALPDRELRLPVICGQGLHLILDGFRKVYALIITFMWTMTMALSKDYFHGHHHPERYRFFNLMTLGATLGVFFSANLFTALVFFEIMSFTSFPWVIQEETGGAIRAADTYLAVAVIGGLTALMGLFLLEYQLGTTEIALLRERAAACDRKGVLYTAGACILFSFGAKAGMFPLHIWLPKAHPVAPAPASALLSGVLTKSGIFGILAISCNLFRNDPVWGTVILGLGLVTMLLGAVLALLSVDLKRTLACSSMSQIGFVLVGIGMMGLLGDANALASRGTLLHMMNHSLFKLVLFMSAGIVYMNLHTLDLNEIRGFGRRRPFLMACFLIGAAGIAGIPGLNGYISKTLLHEAIVEGAGEYGSLLKVAEWIFLVSGGLTLSYMTKLFVCIFAEKGPGETKTGLSMGILSGIALGLAALALCVLGFHPELLMNRIADSTLDFLHGALPEHAIHYYSLENLKGSVISILIGAGVYLLIVRKLLIKDGRYVNVLPESWDLENRVYRPLLQKWMPGLLGPAASLFGENKLTAPLFRGAVKAGGALAEVFGENRITAPLYRAAVRVTGILSRIFSDMTDACILLLRKTVYRDAPANEEPKEAHTIPYQLGLYLDLMEEKLRKEKAGERKHAKDFYRLHRNIVRGTHNLTDSMSFALLMLCGAVCAVMIYILVVHR